MVELLAHGVLLILHSELVVLLAMLLDRIARFSLLLVNGLVFLEVLVIDTVEMINDSLLIKQVLVHFQEHLFKQTLLIVQALSF